MGLEKWLRRTAFERDGIGMNIVGVVDLVGGGSRVRVRMFAVGERFSSSGLAWIVEFRFDFSYIMRESGYALLDV